MPPLRVLVVLGDVALFVVVLAEFLRTPDPRRLGVVRSAPERIGLDVEFVRWLRVVPGPAAGLVLEVREEFPESFDVVRRARACAWLGDRGDRVHQVEASTAPALEDDPTGGADRARLPADAHGEVALARVYRPGLRGLQRLGALRLRLESPLGLLQRQARLDDRQELAVVPPLRGLRRTLRLAASERWQDLGVRRLRRRGAMTTDFESLRAYVTGDDVRLVDWKATARRGAPTVRQFQVERGQELVLLVDCGRRMRATTSEGERRGWTKLDHALDAALQLAAVALQEGDRVGLLAFDREVRAWVPPARGSLALRRLMEATFDLQPRRHEADLVRALREVRARHRRRALLVVLSDVGELESAARTRKALRASATSRVVFAALDDPELRALAEGAQPPGPEASPVRAAALQLVEERREALERIRGPGARVLDALPAGAAGPLLAAWLDERRGAR